MDNFRIMFLRDRVGAPVGCIAMTLSHKSDQVKYQVSTLNPVDNFDRKVARQLAIGRLMESPRFLNLPKRTSLHDMTALVVRDIATSKAFPDRSVKAAKRWLRKNDRNNKTV